jgi:hypothetical protein
VRTVAPKSWSRLRGGESLVHLFTWAGSLASSSVCRHRFGRITRDSYRVARRNTGADPHSPSSDDSDGGSNFPRRDFQGVWWYEGDCDRNRIQNLLQIRSIQESPLAVMAYAPSPQAAPISSRSVAHRAKNTIVGGVRWDCWVGLFDPGACQLVYCPGIRMP